MEFIKKSSLHRIKIYIFFATIFLFIFALGIHNNILDYDLWARLVNGQHVVKNFVPLYNDIFSFTETHTWYDPEWLSSAFLYILQTKFGIVGLTFFKCLSQFFLICFLIFALVKLKVKNSPFNLYYFALFSFISYQVGYLTYVARCQIITFIIFVLWLYLLEKARQNDNRALYFLPLIMLFWLNNHGGCIAGVGVLFIYIFGEFLNKKPVKKYLLTLLFVALVFLINPWGVDYYKFIFDSAFVDRSGISEWISLFEMLPWYVNFYFYYILFAIFSYFYQLKSKKISFKELDKTKFILLFVLLLLSVFHLKHICLALILYTIFLYDDIVDTFSWLLSIINTVIKTIFKIIVYVLMIIYSFLVFCAYSCADSYQEHFYSKYPVHALEFLKQNGYGGKVLANFQYGSFIYYKYYPLFKIYMDGRQEQVYYANAIKKLYKLLEGSDDYDLIIRQNKPDIIILEKYMPANDKMLTNDNYFLLYSDNLFYVYGLNKYKNKKHVKPVLNKKEYFKKLFDTNIDFAKDNKN